MPEPKVVDPERTAVGALLQYWRKARHLSQLALAAEADVSPRHLCFLETGRAKPSRAMVLQLASALDVPFRERNTLLLAAGFAPVYLERGLDAPEILPARRALDAILRQQEPFPAVVMNRHWDILTTNAAASRFFAFLLDEAVNRFSNVVRLMFHPEGLRPYVEDWEVAAQELIHRVHREAVGGVRDETTVKLLEEVFAYPGVPAHFRRPDLQAPLQPIIPIRFRKGDWRFDFFSAVTTLGTPQDVTLQELRIETFFPNDRQTEENVGAYLTRN